MKIGKQIANDIIFDHKAAFVFYKYYVDHYPAVIMDTINNPLFLYFTFNK